MSLGDLCVISCSISNASTLCKQATYIQYIVCKYILQHKNLIFPLTRPLPPGERRLGFSSETLIGLGTPFGAGGFVSKNSAAAFWAFDFILSGKKFHDIAAMGAIFFHYLNFAAWTFIVHNLYYILMFTNLIKYL